MCSHISKPCINKECKPSCLEDFSILGTDYGKNKFRKKITESLVIKEKRSSLNTQVNTLPLKLFN